jgi:hypothetical protein
MVRDFVCGSALTSVLGYAVLWCYVLSNPGGGAGLGGIVLIAIAPGLVVLNIVMVLAVRAGASIKRRSASGPVTVRPRRLMFFVGLLAVPVGVSFAWLVASVFSPVRVLGEIGQLFLASAPVALITWFLARPSPRA